MKTNILLVDDDRHLLLTLCDFLTFKGFEVTTAHNGESAIRVLEELVPDLIILDIGMPGMGGIAFLNHLESEGRSGEIPILVLTGRAAMEEFFSTVTVDDFLYFRANHFNNDLLTIMQLSSMNLRDGCRS